MMRAWISKANERHDELVNEGQLCLWVYERTRDLHYRETCNADIPEFDFNAVSRLMTDLVRPVVIQPGVIQASIARISQRAHLQLFGGAHSTVMFDLSLLQQVSIASGASPTGRPILYLPHGSSASVRELRDYLLLDEPAPPRPAHEMLVITSD